MVVEFYNEGADDDAPIGGIGWGAQSFTLGTTGSNLDYTLSSIKILVFRVGTINTINVSIRAASVNKPIGPNLSTGSYNGNSITTNLEGEWIEVIMTSMTLLASTQYTIVVSAPDKEAGALLGWYYDKDDATYTGGKRCWSINSGSSWSTYADDHMFEVYGAIIREEGFAKILNVIAPQQAYKDQAIEISTNIINQGFDDNLFIKLIANGAEFRQTNYISTGATWIPLFNLIMPERNLNIEIQVGHEE